MPRFHRLLFSINARILSAGLAVVVLFLLIAGLALDRAFQESARTAREERLEGELFMLMAAAELDPGGNLQISASAMNEPRFALPGSGLYAHIADVSTNTVWQSRSVLSLSVPFERALSPGEQQFGERLASDGRRYWVVGHGVRWTEGPNTVALTFSVAEDMRAYNLQLGRYRQTLWLWLAALGAGLLLSLLALLRWGLRPLRQVAREVVEVQAGRQQKISRNYPSEIRLLTDNLNHLLGRERAQMQRYRDALADLAHSLKTPLAVLRGVANDPALLQQSLPEQLERMNHIVAYQLQRASTAGAARFASALRLQPVIDKTVASLRKVYAQKGVQIDAELPSALEWKIDEGDLYELLGNLLDNACKWSTHRVLLQLQPDSEQLLILVGDDGPGVADPQAILKRGVRADEQVPGHGIGLAMISDIVHAYGGELSIGRSALGGALFSVRLPV